MRTARVWTLIVVCLATLGAVASAEQGGEEERKNELSAIVAGTHEDENTFFTLGVEYKRELSDLVALTAIGEMVLEGDSREAVFVFPVVLEPWRGLHLLAGPGFEHSGEDGSSFLVRVGAGWGFEVGERYAITPAKVPALSRRPPKGSGVRSAERVRRVRCR